MIELTKLNGAEFVLNSDLIETVEENPDTTVRLVTKNYYIVRESKEEVVQKIIKFKQRCNGTYNEVWTEL